MSQSVAYLNGMYLPAEGARVSAWDQGLLLGVGLFETLRTYHRVPFRLERHLERLYTSAEELGLDPTKSREEMRMAVKEVIRRSEFDDDEDARVRITLTGGAGKPDEAPGTALITAVLLEELPTEIYQEGARLISTDLDKSMALARYKTTSALHKILAHRDAERDGAIDALFRNPAGRIAECAYSNIFIKTEWGLVTPPIEEGALPGITREIILDMVQVMEIPTSEKLIENETLFRAEEVFIASSIKEVVPIVQIGERTIGEGKVGEVTLRVMESYLDLVKDECAPKKAGNKDSEHITKRLVRGA